MKLIILKHYMQMKLMICTFLLAVGLNSNASAGPVQIYGHVVPPFSMHDDGGNVYGFSADLFKLAFSGVGAVDPKPFIIPVTFNRLYAELQKPEKQIGIAMGRNKIRDAHFKWVGPYLTVHLGVIAKKSKNYKITSAADLGKYRIGVVEKTAPAQLLQQYGFSDQTIISDLYPIRNVQKLAADRIDMMAYPLQPTSNLMKQAGIDSHEYEEVFSLETIDVYFAFSKSFSDAEIDIYQKRIEEILKSEGYLALKNKYALDGIRRYQK